MSWEVFTVAPDTTAAVALAACQERRIRHLPVMQDENLVGIVSDRDLRSATPARGDATHAETFEKVTVSGIMNREVVTTRPDAPIEVAANVMRERGFGCLPVVEEDRLAGILTSSDVMEALVYLVGANEPGSRFEVSMPDRPGALAGVAGVFGTLGINIVSLAMGSRPDFARDPEGWRSAVLRVDATQTKEATELLEQAGYKVLWPPRS